MSGIDLVAVLVAKPGHEDALEAAIQACVPLSAAEPGCQFYRLNRDRVQPNRFVVLERWADEAAIAAHNASGHLQTLAAALPAHLESPPLVMTLEPR